MPLGMAASEHELDRPTAWARPICRPATASCSVPLRPCRAQRAAAGRRAPRAGGADRRRPARPARRGRGRRPARAGRSVADVLLRRTRLGLLAAPQLRTAESVRRSPRRWARSWAGTRPASAPRPSAGPPTAPPRGSIRPRGRRVLRPSAALPVDGLDTGSVAEVEEIAAWGVLAGATTNPSLLAKEDGDPGEIVKRICDLVGGPVSARGRLGGPGADGRRGPGAARAARARHRQGALRRGGARGDARADRATASRST